MSQHLTLDYVEIPSSDLTKTKTFFSDVFGFTFTDFGPEYTAFSDANVNGGFYQSESICSTSTGSVLLVFYSQDLEATEQHVIEAGGTVIKPTFSFPGGRRFHFAEPNGNEYAVWSDIEPQA